MRSARGSLVPIGSLPVLLTLVQGYRAGVRTDLYDTSETVLGVETLGPAVLAVIAVVAAWRGGLGRRT